MKKGDLVRLVKRVPLPRFLDEDVGKVGIITEDGKSAVVGGIRNWVVVLIDGQFRLEAIQNLELIVAQD